MTTHALTPAKRFPAGVAATCALAGALTVLALIGLVNLIAPAGGVAGATSLDGPGFELTLPHGWKPLPASQAARVQGRPLAVIRRDGDSGVVVVREIPTLHGDLRDVAKSLTAQLQRRIAGFHLVSARLGRVRAGGAFLYTFVRGSGGAVQSLAITTVRGKTYRIDSIVPAKEAAAAREAGAIVRSFGR